MEDVLTKTERINRLIDFYLKLFTSRQQEMLTLYYRDDYSLMEVAENFSISRQAVHDQLNRLVTNMEQTEGSLRLLERNLEYQVLFDQLSEKLQHLSGHLPPTVLAEITQLIQQIRQV